MIVEIKLKGTLVTATRLISANVDSCCFGIRVWTREFHTIPGNTKKTNAARVANVDGTIG